MQTSNLIPEDQRDVYVAREIIARRCPFGKLKENQTISHCPLGFPGCACADEWMTNPILTAIIERKLNESKF